jgi:hypothetical protein
MCLLNFKSNFFCWLLVFALLLQSCTVYKKTPVSISEAAATNYKVLITKTNDTIVKYKKIELTDGKYYGITKEGKGKIEKTPLNLSEIKTIRVLDKSASTALTVGILAVPLVVIFSFILFFTTY